MVDMSDDDLVLYQRLLISARQNLFRNNGDKNIRILLQGYLVFISDTVYSTDILLLSLFQIDCFIFSYYLYWLDFFKPESRLRAFLWTQYDAGSDSSASTPSVGVYDKSVYVVWTDNSL